MTTLEPSPPGRSAAGAIAAPHREESDRDGPAHTSAGVAPPCSSPQTLAGLWPPGSKTGIGGLRCAIATTPDRVLALGKVASRVADRDRG
jgi:hypothetical protein